MSPMPSIIKVAVIEDLAKIRAGLMTLIGGTDGFQCTGGFESMEEALAHIGADRPHIVLVDIGLPGMSGVEGIRVLKKQPDGQFVNSKFVEISNKVTYTV